MSIICILCRDPLTVGQANGEGEGEPQGAAAYPAQLQIVATKCGHLFHRYCLARWVNTAIDNTLNTRETEVWERGCPSCKSVMKRGSGQFLNIFPSGSKESDALQAALPRRQQESDLREELRDSQMRLEEESRNHDTLKCEHSKAMAELDRLKLEMDLKEAGHSLKDEAFTGQDTSLTALLLERTILIETLRKKIEAFKIIIGD